METHLLSKFHYGIQKSCDFARWDGITWLTSGPISMHYGKPFQDLIYKPY